MNDISRKLGEIKNELMRKLEYAEQKLAESPGGELRTKMQRGNLRFYHKTTVDEATRYQYIRDDEKNFVRALAEKEYYTVIRMLCIKDLDIMNRNEPHFTYDIEEVALGLLAKGGRTVMNEILAEKQAQIDEWANEQYIPNPYKREYLIYPTLRGEKVRSKGERDIVDELYREGIPYKLEHPLGIDGETIYCDIIILRLSDMKEIYWEHSGMLEKNGYIGSNYDRIAKYASIGILVGQELIITGETKAKPLSTQTIRLIIDAYCR